MDRTEASDAFNAGSIPVGCIYITLVLFYRKVYVYGEKVCAHCERFFVEAQ